MILSFLNQEFNSTLTSDHFIPNTIMTRTLSLHDAQSGVPNFLRHYS